ncbi:APC family permease [uncultured Helicobacter sp.]|uniref:APC family permease n=1 Tax=uncultured Helicobacter sp. TaxID=175537 RepID=UPI003751CAAE
MRHSSTTIFFLCLGCIIGWGVFVLPHTLFLPQIGLLNSLIGLSLGAILIGVIAKDYMFLLARFPQVGGEFLFTLRILGRTHAFICGWFLSLAYLCIIPLNATALPLLAHAFGLEPRIALYSVDSHQVYAEDIALSLVAILVACVANLCGIRYVFALQKALIILLVGSVCFFFLAMSFSAQSLANLLGYVDSQSLSIAGILAIIALAPWLYVGFDCGVQIIQDVRNNPRKITLFTIGAIIAGFLLYAFVLIFSAYGVPYEALRASDISFWASLESVRGYFGVFGGVVLAFGVFGAIASGINGFFITTTKVLYAMSLHRIFPATMCAKNRFGIPHKIVCFVGLVSCVLPFFGRQGLLYVVDMSSVGIVVAFLYVSVIASIVKRRESKRVSLLSMLNILISSVFFALLLLPFSPAVLKAPSLIALGIWGACGVLFYRLAIQNNKNP